MLQMDSDSFSLHCHFFVPMNIGTTFGRQPDIVASSTMRLSFAALRDRKIRLFVCANEIFGCAIFWRRRSSRKLSQVGQPRAKTTKLSCCGGKALMKMLVSWTLYISIYVALVASCTTAFQPLVVIHSHLDHRLMKGSATSTGTYSKTCLASSYLDSLSSAPSPSPAPPAQSGSSYLQSLTSEQATASSASSETHVTTMSSSASNLSSNGVNVPATTEAVVPPVPVPQVEDIVVDDGLCFTHASIDYFDVQYLSSKGPRTTADWGEPQDATRKLADDGILRSGAWYCTKGGWPSPNPKAHTEIFYVLEGHGCLSDIDGINHYFGPGDIVIIPKGHTGRWDVFEPIHKIWAVNDHANVEERTTPIRVQVTHYHTLTSQEDDGTPLYDATTYNVQKPTTTTSTFYDVGPTKVGVWTSEGGQSFPVQNGGKFFFHLLEGVVFVSDANGTARRCVAGDTVMFSDGWSGHVDVVESAKKIWVEAY